LERELVLLLEILDEAALVEVVAPELLDGFELTVVGLDAELELFVRVLDAGFVGIAPAREGVDDEVADILGNLFVVLGCVLHLGAHALVGLPDAGSIVAAEAALDLVYCWGDFCEFLAVNLLGLGAHAGDGQDLSVLDDALLEFAKQDTQSWRQPVSR
jgi:hypothetical protein